VSRFEIIARLKAVLEDADLPSTDTCVLMTLMLSAGERGETTWKQETIAARFGLKPRNVRYILSRLERGGYIHGVRRGKKLANTYLMPWHPLFVTPEVSGKELPITQSDRQPVAALTGKKLPIIPAKNCRSIYKRSWF
jgi:hypothetical protein